MLGVVEDFIAIDSPPAREPLVEVLVEDASLGQLVVHVSLTGQLKRCRLRVNLVVGVLVIRITGRSTEGTNRSLRQCDTASLVFVLQTQIQS